jgi:hypothetical protein
MKTKTKILWAALVLAAFTVQAVDVPLKWDNPVPDIADGITVFVFNRDTGVTNTFDVVAGSTNAVVQIDPSSRNDIWVKGWCEVINPDGTKPRQYSDKSNVLDVKSPGNSGRVMVTGGK